MKKLMLVNAALLLLAVGCASKESGHFRGIDKWGNPIPSSIGCKIRAYDPNDHSQFNTPYESEQVDGKIGEIPLIRWVRDYNGSPEQVVWSSTDPSVAGTTSPTGYQNSLEFNAGGSAIIRASDTSVHGVCYVEFDISVK